ncbi:phage tail protein [[Haemophilus] ducreyi]|uniref:tape measure protein n=1 Tax=Haemophilus ducreyi TaxID=730 RepID=UPI0007CDB9D1|nr:tape measure protein [[Haemophilus] ducreyi]ANF70226.1 phage tail protein [[Haemophilus] ducreyi]ANF72590.1 phage tail protein [[Haemophilus] ducreyi]
MANSELNLALKIKADLNDALSKFKTLEKELQAGAAASQGLGKGAQTGAGGLDGLAKKADEATSKLGKTRAGVESISKQLAELKKQALGFTLGKVAIGNLVQTSDEFKSLEARIKLVSRSNLEAKGTFHGLMAVAQETGTAFSATAELYTRVFRSLGDTANSGEVLRFTKTVSQAMTVSGAGAQEAQAAIIQLSQGMAAGALRGEEFNSVSEQAPIILELLQKSLGKTRGELRKMAEEGQLTTEVIMTAVAEGADSIQKQYEQMPLTIGKAVTQLSNTWLEFIGNTDKTLGASTLVSAAISTLANNLEGLAGIAILVGTAYTARYLSAMYTSIGVKSKAAIAESAHMTAINASATASVRQAQATVVLMQAVNGETVSVGRATQAYGALAVAKARAAAVNVGAGLFSLIGGSFGFAVTALAGLAAAYFYLKSQEEEAERQFAQSLTTLDANIEKTKALVEARTQLGEMGGFSDRMEQLKVNTASLDGAKQKLEALIAERDKLLNQNRTSVMGGLINADEVNALNTQIDELQQKIDSMSTASSELANITQAQLAVAWDAAIEAGGTLAEKLTEIGDPQHPEAVKLLTEAIKGSETEALAMKTEVEELTQKLKKDLSQASTTAIERLEAMRTKFEGIAAQAGMSGNAVQGFINKINEAIGLQTQLEQKQAEKKGGDELEKLRTRARQSGMSELEKNLDNARNNSNWTAEQKKEAEALYQTIEANQKKLREQAEANKAQRKAESDAKKAAQDTRRTAEEATNKLRELNSDYLRLTGQTAKADLLDVQSKYNQLLALFSKANNQEGINLVKKMLPLEGAKVQLNGIQSEVNNVIQQQSAKEQQIQAQVQTGLISHFEGQQRLKDMYAQTVAEIEKQLPLLERLAQMPDAQGEAAGAMLEQMKLKIQELKQTGNELENAFKQGLTQGIQSALMGLAEGTMSLGDAVKQLALTVINSMAQIAAQQLAMQATSAISGFFGGAGAAVTAATGGFISGPGTGTSDSIPARLSNGEFVVRAASVQKYGVGFLHAINRGHLRKYATGGLVSAPSMPSYNEPTLTHEMQNGTAGQQAVASPVNIQQILAVDSAELFTAGINTVAGERAVMTVIRANKQTLKQELG